MQTKMEKIDGKEFKVNLPGHDEDWSEVEKALTTNIKKHLGKSKLTTVWQRREGDLSEYPKDAFSVPEAHAKIKQWAQEEGHDIDDPKIFEWSNYDTLQSLLDSPSGETHPTYLSGSGLHCDNIFDRVYYEMHCATCELVRSINPHIDFESSWGDLAWELVDGQDGKWVREILNDYSNNYLEDIIEDLDKRKDL